VETSADVSAETIRTQLERILASPGFIRSDRMVRFLRFTVEQTIQGQANSLKESVLGMEVFDRTASFDPRTDTIVRVEARRLRSKLKEYYEGDGRGDPVRIDFPKGGYIPTFLLINGRGEPPKSSLSFDPDPHSNKLVSEQPSRVSFRTRWRIGTAIAAGLLLVAVSVGISLWFARSSPPAQPLKLTRITADRGLTYQPALSSDGKLVAYASDRSGQGNLEIWVKQVNGGEPVRLTHDESDDHEPVFSPDGSKIAFRSERDGGGVYLISVLGGLERLIAPQGRRPQISPDGRYLAYFIRKPSSGLEESAIHIVPLAGGTPRELQPEFAYAESPVWSPGGNHLLFLGSKERPPFGQWIGAARNTFDWWVTPLEEGRGAPVSTGAARRFPGFHGRNCRPGSWVAHGSRHIITFSIQAEDTSSLWQVGISPQTWQVDVVPEQLTSGTGLDVDPSFEVNGRLVFTSLVANSDIWSLPIAANRGKVLGALRVEVQSAAADVYPSLSDDGQKLAFNSTRSGHSNVWIKDMKTGKESALTDDALRKDRVLLSPDGSKVAFVAYDGDKVDFCMVASGGGPLRKLCEDCGNQNLLNWSPSGAGLLYYSGWPQRVGLLNIVSGERRTVLEHPIYELHRDTLSPDERWIAFHVPAQTGRSVFVAPLGQQPAPERDWIRVTDGSGMDSWPFWSPDGRLLYFLSERDGSRCVLAQPLDHATKQPVGLPISVLHIHSARRSLLTSRSAGEMGMSLTRDALVFSMREITGNIWMAERER
jgi:eukaryotic-like serine/threonine-protein kinase